MAIIIDNITPENPGFTVALSSTNEQQSCSYNLTVDDTTTVNTPEFDRGNMEYFVDGVSVGSSLKGNTSTLNLCEAGTYTIKQVYTIRALTVECPGVIGEIIYQEDRDFQYTILAWRPLLTMPNIDCCFLLGEQVTFLPSEININNNVCANLAVANSGYWIDPLETNGYAPEHYGSWDALTQILTYNLYKFNMDTAEYELQGDLTVQYGVNGTDINSFPFTFIPSELSKYKLESKITNCCTTVTVEQEFFICDAITISKSCDGVVECTNCNLYYVDNFSSEDIEVTIRDLVLDKEIHTFTVNAGERYSHTFTEDSAYSFTWTIDEETTVSIVNIMCQIDECYVGLLKNLLCRTSQDCCDDSYLESRLANIQAMYQTYLLKVEPYTDLNLRFAQADINNMLSDFQKIGELRNQLLEFCDICKRGCNGCFDWSTGNCI